jgi:hypothetical protein
MELRPPKYLKHRVIKSSPPLEERKPKKPFQKKFKRFDPTRSRALATKAVTITGGPKATKVKIPKPKVKKKPSPGLMQFVKKLSDVNIYRHKIPKLRKIIKKT